MFTGSPLRVVRRLNDAMKRRSRALLTSHRDARVGDVTGSCEFNVTLINLMEPERKESVALKDEGQFGMGKASVSWHSDSSLQDTSTVAVYHQTSGGIDGDDTSWHVALKCLDGVTPALRVPLRSHSAYYMMRDFNLHHHHAVLNGDTRRFSSTHRVAVTARDTFDYVKARCERALAVLPSLKWRAGKWPRGRKPPRDANEPLSNAVRTLGETHREVEFQWIRMFWLQGTAHAAHHDGYWTRRIEELTQAWDVMELGLRFAMVGLFFIFVRAISMTSCFVHRTRAREPRMAKQRRSPELSRCFGTFWRRSLSSGRSTTRERGPGRTRRCPRIAGRWTGPRSTTSRRCRET